MNPMNGTRYQFLAFDFDEKVDVTMENCRLLLLRLKMDGWRLGKTKILLKYYAHEYLIRLYRNQAKFRDCNRLKKYIGS